MKKNDKKNKKSKRKLLPLALCGSAALMCSLANPAYCLQIADGQYQDVYFNGQNLAAMQNNINSLTAKGGGGGTPLGSIIAVPSHTVDKFLENEPDAWLPCDGVSTAGTALETLMTLTPNLNGANGQPRRFLQGTTGNSETVEAGLPNIKGAYSSYYNCMFDFTGSIVHYSSWGIDIGGGYFSYYGHRIGIDASKSSPVYKDDVKTVQPDAYTVRYFIRCNE